MQALEIKVAVKAINPKAFIVKDGDTETLFSYGNAVVHKAAGKVYFDAIGWSRSKSTSSHVCGYMAESREEITNKLLLGQYELARLSAPNVSWTPPTKEQKMA